MTGAANSGLEGLTFVPNAFLPAWMTTSTSGGRFYASIQRAADVGANPNRPNTATNIDDYLIYAFDIDLNNSGRIVKWDGIQYATGTPYQNISDMYFSTETGILYVLYDDSDNRLIEMNTDGTVIKDYSGIPVNGREGIVVVTNYPSDTANLYIASDSETKIVKFSGYPVTYYDRDKDRANFHVDCNDNDPTVSVNQNYYIDNDGDGLGAGAA